MAAASERDSSFTEVALEQISSGEAGGRGIDPQSGFDKTETETETPSQTTTEGTATAQSQSHSEPVAPGAASSTAEPYCVYEYYFKNKSGEFYSSTDGVFEAAVNDIKSQVYNKEIDGETIIGCWLLVEVDHWDNETEKMVMLTEESLITVRYDFVPKKVYKFKRRALKDFDTVQTGEFLYPQYSLLNHTTELKRRTCRGARLLWNKGVEPGFLQNWRPSSEAMPWQTFTMHPLIFSDGRINRDPYSVTHFLEAAVDAIKQAYTKHCPDRSLIVKEEPLYQQIYLGLSSQIHNQSFLGMSKDRGIISF